MIGKYSIDFRDDKVVSDTLEVRADGTYTHTFVAADSANSFSETGTWNFQYIDGEPKIGLHDYTIGFEYKNGIVLKKGGFSAPVKNNGSRFVIDGDIGYYYDRQS